MLLIATPVASWTDFATSTGLLRVPIAYIPFFKEEGITKPNPLLFERAAERIGIYTDESVFIDDRQENCLGAETTGMKSLLYESNEKLTRDLAELVSREQVGVSYEN